MVQGVLSGVPAPRAARFLPLVLQHSVWDVWELPGRESACAAGYVIKCQMHLTGPALVILMVHVIRPESCRIARHRASLGRRLGPNLL